MVFDEVAAKNWVQKELVPGDAVSLGFLEAFLKEVYSLR